MIIRDRPSFAQQESLCTLLAYSEEHGKLAANLLDPGLFDGDYRDIAIKLIGYWKDYGKPPQLHTADLFAEVLEDGSNPRKAESYRRILFSMAALEGGGLNAEYVIGGIQQFSRWQQLKGAVLQAADILQKPLTAESMEAAEQALADVLKARHAQFDRGMRLDDDLSPFLAWLEKHRAEFTTGIDEFDRRGIVPARQEVMLLIAGKGRGKSFWLVNLGKRALRLGHKVLHVSLENSEFETRLRYYQALFSVTRRAADEIAIAHLVLNERNRVTGYRGDSIEAKFSFDSADLQTELESHIEQVAAWIGNLIIIRFPENTLSVEMLEAYLDSLEQIDGWIPDLVLLDYPKLMRLRSDDPRVFRLNLRVNTQDLRKLAVERNFALAIVDQLTREGHKAGKARSHHVGEDWSQTHTADVVLTHSATEAEREHGLCRLYADHVRGAKDNLTIVVAQALATGQFVIDSAVGDQTYYDRVQPKDGAAAPATEAADDGYVQEQEEDRGLLATEE